MNGGRRFSQAIAEGDGISLIARVAAADEAARAEQQGAEAVLVTPADGGVEQVRAATSLPVVVYWSGHPARPPAGADACVVDVDAGRDAFERLRPGLAETCELAFRIADEDHFEAALDEFDPEIFVLAAPGAESPEALERVLDLLPEVPAGKLAIAELPGPSVEDVGALERAGCDGVIVDPQRVTALAGEAPPEV